MGSVGNQNPWASYNTYKDCSQGICSIYCPQWCYIIFPPPPSFSLGGGGGDDNDSGTDFSPLIIAVIGILASAFLLVSYYTIISKYCRPRRDREITNEMDGSGNQVGHEASQGVTGGLDETLIKSITVCKFKKGDGLFIEGKDCSVCLSEFQENESLRLLPKCNHAFHLPCIDTWLRSHASCPLCRAHVASNNILSTQSPSSRVLETMRPNSNASVLEHQHRTNDAVVVMIQESGREGAQGHIREEHVVSPHVHDDMPKTPPIRDLESLQDIEEIDNGVEIRQQGVIQPIRRSVSLNLSASRGHIVSIADILRVVDEDEDDCNNYPIGYGEKGRSGMLRLVRSPVAIQRSVSTGRFMFAS